MVSSNYYIKKGECEKSFKQTKYSQGFVVVGV